MENPTNINPTYKPDIIFITVDQMRFPMHFPQGIDNPDKFVETYMPNLWGFIWRDGVKFHNHYTAASDCTVGRATIYTGLYAYQTYSMLTLITYPPKEPQQPHLHKDFPTIGKLMMEAGYDTPYFGKWHLSYDVTDLNDYGFQSHVPQGDYVGYAGQGMADDASQIATDAAAWINARYNSSPPNPKPYFCPVNFINPHDKQWFWGGMQAEYYNYIYGTLNEKPPQNYDGNIPEEDDPPSTPYTQAIQDAISNWQSQDDLDVTNKPSTQTLIKEVFQYNMGGIFETDREPTYTPCTPPGSPDQFWYAPTDLVPTIPRMHKAVAAPEYWTTALNSYIQVMGMVDQAIGQFMSSIPEPVRRNTVFVFTSDHGEYGSSHGLQGKGATVYEEGIRVPLVVYDPTGYFTKSADVPRDQLTSSVDLLRMIVSMGHGGDEGWMVGPYLDLYGNGKRCDLLQILASTKAQGRTYALHSTDEFIAKYFNYLNAPLHVIGQISVKNGVKTKLGVYTTWAESIQRQSQATVQYPQPSGIEFYNQTNYANPYAPNEKVSIPSEATAALGELFGGTTGSPDNLHNELMAPLPDIYRAAQDTAYNDLIDYMNYVNTHPPSQSDPIAGEEGQRRLGRAWAY